MKELIWTRVLAAQNAWHGEGDFSIGEAEIGRVRLTGDGTFVHAYNALADRLSVAFADWDAARAWLETDLRKTLAELGDSAAEGLDAIADLVMPIDRDNEMTDTPYWLIVSNVCGGQRVEKGVFFSRDAAERYLKRYKYSFPPKAYVYCPSAGDSDIETLYTLIREWRFARTQEPTDG